MCHGLRLLCNDHMKNVRDVRSYQKVKPKQLLEDITLATQTNVALSGILVGKPSTSMDCVNYISPNQSTRPLKH